MKNDSWLIITDAHFPYGDEQCVKAIMDYAIDYGVENLMLLGDVFDFHEISKWGDKFRMTIEEELALAQQQLEEWIIKRGNFKRKVFIKGNHEDRLERYITDNARKIQRLLENKGFTLPEITGLNDMGFEYVDNNKMRVETGEYFHIGHLYFMHGHEVAGSGKYPARNKLSKAHDNILFGHFHKTDEAIEFDLKKKPSKCWSVGCSCGIIPDYQPFNEWNQGFAIVRFRDGGKFSVDNKVIVNGEVY